MADELESKKELQNGCITISISSNTYFGSIKVSIYGQTECIYDEAQNAIDFINKNIDNKEENYG